MPRPDTMFSFDQATGVMYTCDAFGAHYATPAPFDTELQALAPHFRFYYDCLMRPNARSVLTALRKVKDLDYTTVATGHGPIIRYNLDELVGRWVVCISLCLASLRVALSSQRCHVLSLHWSCQQQAHRGLAFTVRSAVQVSQLE